jgi:hypothetical protein
MTKYQPDTFLPEAWIVDIDGTLTLGPHQRGPFEWHKVGNDLPNWPVIAVVNALEYDQYDIVFVSGRSERCRRETHHWLDKNLGCNYSFLYMRPIGDFRPDEIVKAEIFDNEIAPWWNVRGVIDDRAKVVKMWRDKGLTCLQVAEGAF